MQWSAHCSCRVGHATAGSTIAMCKNQHHSLWEVEGSMHPTCFLWQDPQDSGLEMGPPVVSILATTSCSESLVAGNATGGTKIHWCHVVSVVFHQSTKVP